mmetsp:Transcript_30554/g.51165  ORF Transcript_30554/g.51165 Transcript_30554/m.51165 type:complete len:397 (-) Transcript_30554:673-1863(-)
MFTSWKILVALCLLGRVAYGVPIAESEVEGQLKQNLKIAAFYNVYTGGDKYKGIVDSQVKSIHDSGLIDQLDRIFYSTMGSEGATFDISDEKYTHLAYYGEEGEEVQTLSMLYKFCNNNPTSKVLYFHDKGSFHYSYENLKFGALLRCYVLNPHCIKALDDHDICGWRISPTPLPHYSGNFWWARCDYVNKLIDPMSIHNNETFIAQTKELECINADGRYFAESWIASAPTFYPADCMNETIDTSYLWGYQFPPAADQFCLSSEGKNGLPCGTAATFEHPTDFKHAMNHMAGLISDPKCRDTLDALIKRSNIWYGEAPHTEIEWMRKMSAVGDYKSGDLIRFTDSTQVYMMVDGGELQGFPNLDTFVAYGKDLSDVKVLYASDKSAFAIGPMLAPK